MEIADNSDLEPNDRRVRIDTRKWLMGRLHPRQWGDKTILSGDPDAPLVVNTVQLDRLSDVELHCADNKRRIGITGDDLAVTSAAHIKSRHYPFCRVNTDASVIWFEL